MASKRRETTYTYTRQMRRGMWCGYVECRCGPSRHVELLGGFYEPDRVARVAVGRVRSLGLFCVRDGKLICERCDRPFVLHRDCEGSAD